MLLLRQAVPTAAPYIPVVQYEWSVGTAGREALPLRSDENVKDGPVCITLNDPHKTEGFHCADAQEPELRAVCLLEVASAVTQWHILLPDSRVNRLGSAAACVGDHDMSWSSKHACKLGNTQYIIVDLEL